MKNTLSMSSSWRRWSDWGPRRLGVAATLLRAGATVVLLHGSARADDIPLPTNRTPERQIRFSNASGAEERRAELVQFIWPDGLPTELPTAYPVEHFPPELSRSLVRVAAKVERLDVNIGAWDYHAQVLLLHPTRPLPKHRLVLIHQGHSPLISFGLERAMQHFLDAGLSVAVFHMPLYGWNTDRDGRLPDGTVFDFSSHAKVNHDGMFEVLAPKLHGQMFRFFLEPVVQTINLWVHRHGADGDVSMIGLSGGGWATSMAAALDVRIKFSAPVAGSAPLYARDQDRPSVGDTEQIYAPLYDESIAEDGTGGGVATWLEIYALGAIGRGRRQCMITNQFDTCCFSGHFADSFKHHVASVVQQCGEGTWEHVLDSSHQEHKISGRVLNQVVAPALRIPAWTDHNLPLFDRFADLKSPETALPRGWALAPRTQGNIAYAGPHVVLQGQPTASMLSLQTFDALGAGRFQCQTSFVEIGPRCEAGMWIVSGADSRAPELGLLVHRALGAVFVEVREYRSRDPKSERLRIGALDGYQGGPLRLLIEIAPDGFIAQLDGESQWTSDRIPWSQIPGGFSPSKLGDAAMLAIRATSISERPDDPPESKPSRVVVETASVEVPPPPTGPKDLGTP